MNWEERESDLRAGSMVLEEGDLQRKAGILDSGAQKGGHCLASSPSLKSERLIRPAQVVSRTEHCT